MYEHMDVPAHAIRPGDQLAFWVAALGRRVWLVVLKVGHSHCGTRRWFRLANDKWVNAGADEVVGTKKVVYRDRELLAGLV